MKILSLALIGLSCLLSINSFAQLKQPPMVLWYNQPATLSDTLPYLAGKTTNPFDDRFHKGWVEALPIGNGKSGAMVYGGVSHERIQLNEESLWAGYPRDENNPAAAAALPVVRQYLFEGKDDSAMVVGERTMIGIPKKVSPYQTMGDVWIEFPGISQKNISDYYRDLNLDQAITTVRFKKDGVVHTREAFASHPDEVIAFRLSASQKGKISMKISIHREQDAVSVAENGRLYLKGQLNVPDTNNVNRGMSFQTQLLPVVKGGTQKVDGNQIVITNADEVIFYIAQATSYSGIDPEKKCHAVLKAVSETPFDVLKKKHIQDYQKLYNRVALSLNEPGKNASLDMPTDERIKRVAATEKGDDYLSVLQYQYSRYLMIACSRPGDLPANLQGMWNQHIKPAWESDYHTNINFQMNYWFVETANLAECHKPLINYLDTLVKKGARTAKVHYNAKGWVAHHASDLFGYTAPVASVHGVWPVGGAWVARHSYEHFLYNGDTTFLRERAYPQLRGAAEFFLDFLIKIPEGLPHAGKLVTNPSHSPENAFERPDGVQSQFTYGATMDIQIINDLFDNCLEAISILQKQDPDFDKEFSARLQKAQENLVPIQISSSGRIQEWIEDYKELEPGHRHISHLYSLYPDNSISKTKTPELAEAAQKTLEVRLKGTTNPPDSKYGNFDSFLDGKKGTGWGRAWVSLFYARLGMGDEAYKHHQYLQSNFVFPNMFGIAHGTYQIDNVFGNAAAIGEMLIQSQDGFVHLLPALPAKWKNGFANGLRAIGGFEVDMRWQESKINELAVRSSIGGVCKLKAGRKVLKVMSGKKSISFNEEAEGIVSFPTEAAKQYKVIFE